MWIFIILVLLCDYRASVVTFTYADTDDTTIEVIQDTGTTYVSAPHVLELHAPIHCTFVLHRLGNWSFAPVCIGKLTEAVFSFFYFSATITLCT